MERMKSQQFTRVASMTRNLLLLNAAVALLSSRERKTMPGLMWIRYCLFWFSFFFFSLSNRRIQSEQTANKSLNSSIEFGLMTRSKSQVRRTKSETKNQINHFRTNCAAEFRSFQFNGTRLSLYTHTRVIESASRIDIAWLLRRHKRWFH